MEKLKAGTAKIGLHKKVPSIPLIQRQYVMRSVGMGFELEMKHVMMEIQTFLALLAVLMIAEEQKQVGIVVS